jgi:hypothetical protein
MLPRILSAHPALFSRAHTLCRSHQADTLHLARVVQDKLTGGHKPLPWNKGRRQTIEPSLTVCAGNKMKWVTADGGFVGYIDPRESADLQSIPASKHIGLDDCVPNRDATFCWERSPVHSLFSSALLRSQPKCGGRTSVTESHRGRLNPHTP